MLLLKTMSLVTLTNAEHYSFMKEVIGVFKTLEGKSENEVFKQSITDLNTAFAKETKIYKQSIEKRGTQINYDLAERRRSTYLAFKHGLQAIVYAKLDTADKALVLLDYFNLFKDEIKKGIPSQTAAVDNVLEELTKSENQQLLTETEMTKYYAQLKQQHEEFVSHQKGVRDYDRDYIKAGMQSARQATDTAYKLASRRLENQADMFGGELTAALLDLNASIEAFKDSVKRREINRETAKRKEEEQQAGNKPTDGKPSGSTNPEGEAGDQKPSTGNPEGEGKPKPQEGTQPKPDGNTQPKPDTDSGHGTGGVTEVFPEGSPEANSKTAK